MKHTHALITTAIGTVLLTGCGMFSRPSVGTAGYYIDNRPESKATLVIGSNGTQANALHGTLAGTAGEKGEPASDKSAGAGQFVNWNSGNRSADIDATAALQSLSRVSDTTNGQAGARDSSPQTTTQTPTTTEEHTTSVPVAVSKEGAASTVTPASK